MLRLEQQSGAFFLNKPLCAPDILNVATYHAVYGHFIAGMHKERYDSGIKNCSDKERIYMNWKGAWTG